MCEALEGVRIWVTGASGLLGRSLVKELSAANYVLASGRTRTNATWPPPNFDHSKPDSSAQLKGKVFKVDVTSEAEVEKIAAEFKPQIIIHNASRTENSESARQVNETAAKVIAKVGKKIPSCWILYFSSADVFEGKGAFKPNSNTAPKNDFAKSKLAGEQHIWGSHTVAGVVRVPLLYGRINTFTEGHVAHLIEKVVKKKETNFDDSIQYFPTFVDDVAFLSKQLCERRQKHCNLSGTWHWSSSEKLTDLQMAKAIANAFGIDSSSFKGTQSGDHQTTSTELDCTALKLMGMGKATAFADGIAAVAASTKSDTHLLSS